METSRRAIMATLIEDRHGNVAIPFALMSFVMLGTVTLAIDVGRNVHMETQLQNALDAAAIAALKAPSATRDSVGTQVFNLNMQNAIGTFTPPTFEVLGNGAVKATSTAMVETVSARLMQAPDAPISGLAIADPRVDAGGSTGAPATGPIPCLHIMDQSGSDAWKMVSASNLHADTCDVYVRTNSSQAIYEDSSSDVRFHNVWVKGAGMRHVGGGTMQIVNDPHHIQFDMPVVGDPYEPGIRAVTQTVLVGNCTAANTNKTYTGTVNPGTYCGNTTFNGTTFNPGLYIIATQGSNSGALNLKGKLNGSAGVSFYLSDNKSTFKSYTASEGSVLKAPTSGLSRGLLFFENSNRGATYPLTISSVNKQTWNGLIYLPSLDLTMNSLSEWEKWYLSMEVNRLTMISPSAVWEPFPWIPFNATTPVTYDPAQFAPETVVTVENPIYLSK